jgi:hypothetical protein
MTTGGGADHRRVRPPRLTERRGRTWTRAAWGVARSGALGEGSSARGSMGAGMVARSADLGLEKGRGCLKCGGGKRRVRDFRVRGGYKERWGRELSVKYFHFNPCNF